MGEKRKILLAEDNFINQKVASVNLKQLGHEVDVAANGQLAVEMFIANDYDVILMDIQMPVMDGLDATLAIRKYEAENNLDNIKIVAITANALAEDKARCIDAGMNEYITKPIKVDDLKRVLG